MVIEETVSPTFVTVWTSTGYWETFEFFFWLIFLVSSSPSLTTLRFPHSPLRNTNSLHKKPYFLFPNVLKRWSFQKILHWNMIFLVSSGKMIFLFPENLISFFRRKMKGDLSQRKTKQKKTWKYDIFFKCSENILQMFFFKRIVLEYDLSYIIRKDGICFSRKYFFYGWKIKDDLSQKADGNTMLFVCW